jgi:hypothetical protein
MSYCVAFLLQVLLFCISVHVSAQDGRQSVNPTPNTVTKHKSLSERLLDKAEKQFSAGHFFQPTNANAYDLFRAVKMIEPQNKRAEAGLQAIMLSEIERARGAIEKSRFANAERIKNQLRRSFDRSPMLDLLDRELRQAKKQAEAKRPVSVLPDEVAERLMLDEGALKAKSASLVTQLQTLALRVKESREGVLIYARSDAQGRWIYQQMRKAVPDYRIRGDLRIGKPSVRFLPPFEGQ